MCIISHTVRPVTCVVVNFVRPAVRAFGFVSCDLPESLALGMCACKGAQAIQMDSTPHSWTEKQSLFASQQLLTMVKICTPGT